MTIPETIGQVESQGPAFPRDHREGFVVWDDVDRYAMPRDAFAWERRYLRTRSTGTLHDADGRWTCVRTDGMADVVVPLVADSPDTAKRCSRCIGYGRGPRPPKAMAKALGLVGRLKWLEDFVTALEARVDTLDRASVVEYRRRGPLSAHVDDDELDPRVREAARGVLAGLERRRLEAFARMDRRLREDRSDIEEHLDRLVPRLAVSYAWAELEDQTRIRVWPLVRAARGRCQAQHVWDAASRAWAEAVPLAFEARVAHVDEAIGSYLEPPVVDVTSIRDVSWSAPDGRDHELPTAWLDAEFLVLRTRLARHWTETLDARYAAALRLHEEGVDRWLLVTDWDTDGPRVSDDDYAILTAFPRVTAEVERPSSWARSSTVALVRAPAVLASWLAGNEWGTHDMGPAEGPLDDQTLEDLMKRLRHQTD